MHYRSESVLADPKRLLALRSLGLLDTPPDPDFDRWTRLVKTTLDADTALITLLDRDRQFFKSAAGLGEPWATLRQTPLSHSFCQYVVIRDQALVVTDAREDPELADNKAIDDIGVIAYAGVPLRSGHGHLLGSLAAIQNEPRVWTERDLRTLRDLADAVTTKMEMKALHERTRAITANVSDLVSIFDERGRTLYHSASVERILGYHPDDRLGESFLDLIHPEDRGRLVADLDQVLAEPGVTMALTLRVRDRDGHYRTLESQLTNMLDDPAIRGVLSVGRDLTEERELEAQLLHAQKLEAVGRLAGGIAHDFNNLLTVIRGTARLVLDDLPPDSPSREDVEQIRDTAGRAAELTSQLLAFSRQQVLQPRVVDLNDVVRRSERILQRTIGEDVEVVTELTEEPCTVRLDPVQFEHVILNLAVNARDAMPEGGRLGVSTRRLDPEEPVPESLGAGQPHVALEVTDTGHGMDAATLDRALEPFFTTKDVGKGTGLGLSTVYGIVKQSDGALTVDSEPGAGTRITIVLPYTDEAPTPEPAASRPVPDPAAEDAVILLVEDDDGVRRLVHRVLTRRGFTVLTAAHGTEAIEVVEAADPAIDLLVTDMVMPEKTGIEIADEIRRRAPGTPALFISGYTADSSDRVAAIVENEHFLPKPFTPDELHAAVQRVILEATGRRE